MKRKNYDNRCVLGWKGPPDDCLQDNCCYWSLAQKHCTYPERRQADQKRVLEALHVEVEGIKADPR